MQLPVQQFPVLSPGQMNPFNQAFQSALDSYSSLTKNQYLEPKLQSDILSKAAYAAYSPYSSLAKAMENPLVVGSMSNDQIKRNMDILGNVPSNPLQFLKQTYDQNGFGHSNSLWHSLKDMLGMNVNQPNQQGQYQQPGQPIQQGQSIQQNQLANVQPYGSVGSSQPEPESPGKIGDTGLDLSQPNMNSFKKDFGSPERNIAMAKKYPSQEQTNQAKQQEGEVTGENELWNKRIEDNGKSIGQTQDSLNNLDEMKRIYKEMHGLEKGVIFGQGYPITSKAQRFDNLAEKQSTSNLRALQTGHITNVDFEIGKKLKAQRNMNEGAFNATIDYNKALLMREKQKQIFDAESKRHRIPIEDADSAWSQFIQEHPLFDVKTDKLITDNAKLSLIKGGKAKLPSASGSDAGSEKNVMTWNQKTGRLE